MFLRFDFSTVRRALQKQVEALIHEVVLGCLWEEDRKRDRYQCFLMQSKREMMATALQGDAQAAWRFGSDQLVNKHSFLHTLLSLLLISFKSLS